MSDLAKFAKETQALEGYASDEQDFIPPAPGTPLYLDFYKDGPHNVVVSLEAVLCGAGTNRWLIQDLRIRGCAERPTASGPAFFELPLLVSYADETGLRTFESRMFIATATKLDGLLSLAGPERVDWVQRRRHPRLRISAAAFYFLPSADSRPGKRFEAEVLDISEGGMCLSAYNPAEPRQYILVAMPLDLDVLEATAEVLECQQLGDCYILRLCFDNDRGLKLPEEKRVAIADFIAERANSG